VQCKEWIKNNIKILNFLYFLCSAVFIGIFLYIAWKHDLSTGMFFWGMLFLIYALLLNFEILRDKNKIFLLKNYTEDNTTKINDAVSFSGVILLIFLILLFVELRVAFNTIPINLLFFSDVLFFMLLPLWISWDTFNDIQKLFL